MTAREQAVDRLRATAPGLAFITLWVGLLELAAGRKWINPAFSPVPGDIGRELSRLVTSTALLDPLASTLGLLAAGFLSASAAGILLGLLMGYSKAAYNLLEPSLEMLRPIPKPALLPPLILLLGLGAPMKIVIVFLGAVFPVLINAIQGVRSIDPVLLDVARTFRHGGLAIAFRVILPASLPIVLSGMRVSLGLGLVLVTLAEMLTGADGLGAQIVDAQRAFRVQEMYAWIVILACLGLLLAFAFDRAEERLIFWSSRR